MTDNIVKEMLKKISRRAKAWEQRYKDNKKEKHNPYTEFGFLDDNKNPLTISELKEKYKGRYFYKMGILKNISKSDYIKTRDALFIDNLKDMALQVGDIELYNKLEKQSQAKTMIEYYEGEFDDILNNFDSEQRREDKAIEKAKENLEKDASNDNIINNRPLN